MVCEPCQRPGAHTASDCEDAQHPHRVYRGCPCQHQPRAAQPEAAAPPVDESMRSNLKGEPRPSSL